MPPKTKKTAQSPPPPAPAPDYLDIDLAAALPPTPVPKRGRGRPPSSAPIPPRKYKTRKDKGVKRKPQPAPLPAPIYINIGDSNINNNRGSDGKPSAVTNSKVKLTEKEAKFLEIYFAGNISQVNALKAAGYEGYNERYYETLARKIIVKHESQVEDHRILGRAMGAGEVRVFNSLLSLMSDKSPLIRLNATAQLAKILGMTKEQVDGAGGITIIFEAPDQPGQPAALPARPDEIQPVAYQRPVKVLQITR